VFGQTVAELVDGDTTEGQLLKHELVLMLHSHRAQHAQGLGNDLRTDSVASEHGDMRLHARRLAS
jgi:hypothetical protein